MKQACYTIESNLPLAPGVYRMCLVGDTSAITAGGQFVDVAIGGFFLRRPIAVQKWDSRSMHIVYKVVGKGTEVMSRMTPGQSLDVLTGLGNGFDAGACKASALIVSGGLGASPVFSLAKSLVEAGRKVEVIMGFNSAADVILADEFKALGASVDVVTMDGSCGLKGLVTDAMPSDGYDYFYTCGPKVMMKAVCAKASAPGEASLEERMGCGCGICYGCTCHTASGPKRVCADGPVFKKEEIIW
ncbi:MAG: dihydroorotate dehydrogenase electron transfer subunit [Bacteroidales bacterium]|nr:dihydroorotate dehydrogenase electron transfer subunit [Candidatus Cryptobacteroides aphodequi]